MVCLLFDISSVCVPMLSIRELLCDFHSCMHTVVLLSSIRVLSKYHVVHLIVILRVILVVVV